MYGLHPIVQCIFVTLRSETLGISTMPVLVRKILIWVLVKSTDMKKNKLVAECHILLFYKGKSVELFLDCKNKFQDRISE